MNDLIANILYNAAEGVKKYWGVILIVLIIVSIKYWEIALGVVVVVILLFVIIEILGGILSFLNSFAVKNSLKEKELQLKEKELEIRQQELNKNK